MKRISVVFLFITAMAAASMPLLKPAAATSLSDSLRIGRDTLELLVSGDEDIVMRLYCGNFMDGFAEGESIAALTGEEYVSEQVYMTRPKRGHEVYRTIKDGEVHALDGGEPDGRSVYEIVSSPERILPGGARVENVWCLYGGDGIYIYFVTNRGDYVYYKSSIEAEEEYVLPAEKFTEFARSFTSGAEFDLSPYMIEKNTIDVFFVAASALALLGVAALCGFAVFNRR